MCLEQFLQTRFCALEILLLLLLLMKLEAAKYIFCFDHLTVSLGILAHKIQQLQTIGLLSTFLIGVKRQIPKCL